MTDPDLWWISDAAAQLDVQMSDTAVYERIRLRLHRSNRRGVPVVTDSPGILFNTRALRLLLAETIWETAHRDIGAIEFDTAATSLTAVDVAMIARYGDHLATVGGRICAAVETRLTELLGPVAGAGITRHVHWSDLESSVSGDVRQ